MKEKGASWWLLLADAAVGTVFGAFFGVYYELTALLIMEFYNPYHLRVVRGTYDLREAVVSMILCAPIGTVTGILVNGTNFDVSRERALRRTRFLLLFIGPALAMPFIANLFCIGAGDWLISFVSGIMLPIWAVGLSRIMRRRKA